MPDPRAEMISVLRSARALLAREGNDFSWSSWKDASAALAEVDALIDGLTRGEVPDRLALSVLFAATGPIQEASLSSGWADNYLQLASRFDAAEARLYGP